MKRIVALLTAVFSIALGFSLAFVHAAVATGTTGPSFTGCPNLAGWYVNEDEGSRKPEATEDGLKFEPADLIHHETTLALADLKPGTFSAAPAPDQGSFFSVEVRDATTGAYGTLRWNGSAWELTTNLDQFAKQDPAGYVGVATKWGTFTAATKVISFGVGYTKNPPGSVTTVVKSVTFGEKTYNLTCPPRTSPSASASVSASASASASAGTSGSASPSSSSPAAGAGGGLPVTGPPIGLIVAGGVLLAITGFTALFVARRRKVNFRA
jgi:hypothetical protein